MELEKALIYLMLVVICLNLPKYDSWNSKDSICDAPFILQTMVLNLLVFAIAMVMSFLLMIFVGRLIDDKTIIGAMGFVTMYVFSFKMGLGKWSK